MLCGPSDVVFKKPAVLSFQHCAALKQGPWSLSVYYSDSAPEDPPNWQARLLTKCNAIHLEICSSIYFCFFFLTKIEIGDAWRGNDQHTSVHASWFASVPLGYRSIRALRADWWVGLLHEQSNRYTGHQDSPIGRVRSIERFRSRILVALLRVGRHCSSTWCHHFAREAYRRPTGWQGQVILLPRRRIATLSRNGRAERRMENCRTRHSGRSLFSSLERSSFWPALCIHFGARRSPR